LLSQTSFPVAASIATKLGASGTGMLTCPSSTPLPVVAYRIPSTTIGELTARLWGNTSSSAIMSYSHTKSPSVGPFAFSSVTAGALPSLKPSVSRQTSVARLDV
jgi:hypothetical protein